MKVFRRIWIWLLLLFAAAAVGGLVCLSGFVLVDGTFYPKNQEILDLRDREITPDLRDTLAETLPDTRILWNVPFQGRLISSDTREITVSGLSPEDIAVLPRLEDLKTIHAEGCTDYEILTELQAANPQWDILYTVTLSGGTYDRDAETVDVPGLAPAEIELLRYLPRLKVINAQGCRDYPLILELKAQHPEWEVHYSVNIHGHDFPEDAEEITIENAAFRPLSEKLAYLPKLKTVTLVDPTASVEKLRQLREQYPNVEIHWQLNVYGHLFDEDITEMDISGAEVGSTEEVEAITAYFPNLETLIMSDCGISNNDMAAFRTRMRGQYKVVWTVYFGGGAMAVRTDEKTFMPWKAGISAFQEYDTYNLGFCEEMITVDVGHGDIRTVNFVYNMPNLRYLILAHTQVSDITPLSTCKNLVFLELDYTYYLFDYTPLLGCTALQDLNMGYDPGDWQPIAQMTWLKNLWWNACPTEGAIEALQEALPNTHIESSGVRSVDNGWRKLPNYYAMRNTLGMFYDS